MLKKLLLAWRERTKYAKESDYVFPSVKLRGKKPLSASIMVQKYLRPAAISAGGFLRTGRDASVFTTFAIHWRRHW